MAKSNLAFNEITATLELAATHGCQLSTASLQLVLATLLEKESSSDATELFLWGAVSEKELFDSGFADYVISFLAKKKTSAALLEFYQRLDV
jgi:hypothetical protein